jgi:hypothetical protein
MNTLSVKSLKAKKQHICNLCGFPIFVGEIYENQANVADGFFYKFKSHRSCLRVAHELDMFNLCDDGVSEDAFYEFIDEEYWMIMDKKFPTEREPGEGENCPFEERLKFVKNEHNIQ